MRQMLGRETANTEVRPPINSLADLSEAVTAIANRAIKYGTVHTLNGNYIFDAKDFCDLISQADFVKYFDLIANEVQSREELLDLEADPTKHRLDCNFGLAYCASYEWQDGDEATFECSYEEWENAPVLPVSQPLSMYRMSQIANEAISSTLVWFEHPKKELQGTFGISDEELEQLQISTEE